MTCDTLHDAINHWDSSFKKRADGDWPRWMGVDGFNGILMENARF